MTPCTGSGEEYTSQIWRTMAGGVAYCRIVILTVVVFACLIFLEVLDE